MRIFLIPMRTITWQFFFLASKVDIHHTHLCSVAAKKVAGMEPSRSEIAANA